MADVLKLSVAVGLRWQTAALGPAGGSRQQQMERVIFCRDNKRRESDRPIRHFLAASGLLGGSKDSFFRSALG
jgi:hypothetical protein